MFTLQIKVKTQLSEKKLHVYKVVDQSEWPHCNDETEKALLAIVDNDCLTKHSWQMFIMISDTDTDYDFRY